MKTPKIMVIFGTRPEAIKMAPVVQQLQHRHDQLDSCVVVTGQHRSMLDQVLDIFNIAPDYDLDIMRPNQSLAEITVRALNGLERIIHREKPNLVLVQGDTTTAFVGGLIAFYHKIPIGHVEAGLRTRNKYNPYPEEINRHLLDVLADLHFAPTLTAKRALLAEGTPDKKILITGNTVIDALLTAVAQEHCFDSTALQQIDFSPTRRTLLITTHRRESLGTPLKDICLALRDLLISRKDLQIVFPVHLNPQVRKTVWSILDGLDRAYLTDPLYYLDFVHVMMSVDLIVTDSGGVQEEAPSLGKPVLVIRAATERTEAIEAGTARLVGTTRKGIVTAVSQLLDDRDEFARMRNANNPYGDGRAAKRIVDSICHYFGRSTKGPEPFQANSRIQSSQTKMVCNTDSSHNSDKFICGV